MLDEYGVREYRLKCSNANIRVLKRGEKYFIFNEGNERIDNVLCTNDGGRYAFTLDAGESFLFKGGNTQPKFIFEKELPTTCKTWVKESEQDEYAEIDLRDYTQDLCLQKGYENFAGKIKYQVQFSLEKHMEDLALDFGRVIGG